MTIQFINYPYIYTKCAKRIHADEITGTVRIGAVLEALPVLDDLDYSGHRYKVVGGDVDSDCPGGVCPVR
ncbi:hypothetical protein [Anaerotalea alkaliphila]|uniref:Uncharacterized protein n=1 Tax=Anaerotalea alkaliphila TaxID=2662126 RepID=A0A7X5KN08_9FIRM|nr:hypothetical protein [Anaerotalea alkaliphila]NDL68506.1 hypothetical protein [Anaerotalea alkaliphila]